MPEPKHSLEDLLRIIANAGELTYLSLIPRVGHGPGGVVFSASYSPAMVWGSGFGEDPDPVKAIIKAINDPRLSKLVKSLKIDTTVLPMVIQKPLTDAELARAAGGPRVTAEEATAAAEAEDEEAWAK